MPAPPSRPDAPSSCRVCGRAYAADVLACPSDGSVLPLEGRLLDGKFRLDHKIGDGGMASVWQATNVRVEKTVAIKLMHTRFADDPELLARFRNEAVAAGKIGSEHICDVLDFGESPIGPYIVMELLDGCSLADLIQKQRRLDPGLAVWIVRQALAGLAAAHRAGIIHRDLKPENIHLCRAIRGQWQVKLMDFGISKFAQDPNTAVGATLGTPHYMAPEQIQGAARVDARADLWSIGVILYEGVTGVQLFARDTVAAGLAALRGFDPPPLTQHRPEAPRGLAEVVARCLVRDPARRVPSAEALAEALAPFEQPGPRARAAADAAVPKGAKRAAEAQPARVQPVMAQPVQPVQPAAAAPVRAAASGVKPVLADRSIDPGASQSSSLRAPRLPMPSGHRTGAQPVVARGPAQDTPRAAASPVVDPRSVGAAVRTTAAAPVVVKAAAQPVIVKPAAQPVIVKPAVKVTGASPVVARPTAGPLAAKQVKATSAQPAKRPPQSFDEKPTVPLAGAAGLGAAMGPMARPAPADGKRPAPARRPGRPAPAHAALMNQPWLWVVVVALFVGLLALVVVLAIR